MSLFKPEPFSSEVNRLVNTLFTGGEEGAQRWMPAMDLVEADDHFLLRADLPGLGEDDVSIEIQDNTLTISGERRSEDEQRERGWYRVERSFGRFSRSLTLPEGVNPEAVTASFDRGVLSVRIPKPEERKPRRVTISPGAQRIEQPAVEGIATERPVGESIGSVGEPAPVAGGEQDQPEGPGISPDAPPVDQPGEADRHEHPAERTRQAAAAPEQMQVAAGETGPDPGAQSTGDEPTETASMATISDEDRRAGKYPHQPTETAATPAGSSVDEKFTGLGGLDRESSIEEGSERHDAQSEWPGRKPETPEDHPDPGDVPPSQGPG